MLTLVYSRRFLIPRNVAVVKNLRCLSSNASDSTTSEPKKKEEVQSPEFYDIVVCGGGMVGSAMAYAVGRNDLFKNLKIALIETSPKSGDYTQPETPSNRTCALSPTTQDFFKYLGNWNYIESHRVGKVQRMQVWDGSSDSHIVFANDDASNLAVIVENNLIQSSLTRDLDKFSNVDIFYSSQLEKFSVDESIVDLTLSGGRKLSTSLLIGSDGPNSKIRQSSMIKITKWDYDQMAIVATLQLPEGTTNDTAWQRFLPTGPIALLPMTERYSSLVWSVKKKVFKELMSLSDEDFVARVNHAFVSEDDKDELACAIENGLHKFLSLVEQSKVLPQLESPNTDVRQLPPKIESVSANSRGAYPLSYLHANNYVQNRIALIGDAVHRVHPLAGQGVNLGFGDVMALSKSLEDNVQKGAEIGVKLYLENYESTRQKEAFVKTVGIDMLNRLYTDFDYPVKTPLVALRSIGLTLSNRISPLKAFYKEQAMK